MVVNSNTRAFREKLKEKLKVNKDNRLIRITLSTWLRTTGTGVEVPAGVCLGVLGQDGGKALTNFIRPVQGDLPKRAPAYRQCPRQKFCLQPAGPLTGRRKVVEKVPGGHHIKQAHILPTTDWQRCGAVGGHA